MKPHTSPLSASSASHSVPPLESARRHWRQRGDFLRASKSPGQATELTIAISRERGCGGEAIARLVGAKLDWPVYDRELVDCIAEDSGVRAQLVEALDEQRPNWLTECLSGFSPDAHMGGAGFAVRLHRVLAALCCHGACVILGRGAAQVLPAEQTLRVRLFAPVKYRVKRAASESGQGPTDAKELAAIDRARAEFVKSYFHSDVADVRWYDLTIDTSRFSDEACADLIVAAASECGKRLDAPISQVSNRQ